MFYYEALRNVLNYPHDTTDIINKRLNGFNLTCKIDTTETFNKFLPPEQTITSKLGTFRYADLDLFRILLEEQKINYGYNPNMPLAHAAVNSVIATINNYFREHDLYRERYNALDDEQYRLALRAKETELEGKGKTAENAEMHHYAKNLYWNMIQPKDNSPLSIAKIRHAGLATSTEFAVVAHQCFKFLGIRSAVISNFDSNNEDHTYNVIDIDGKYNAIDTFRSKITPLEFNPSKYVPILGGLEYKHGLSNEQ
jgi:hypothetical protein